MTDTPDPEVADADRANGEPAATADDAGRDTQPDSRDDVEEHGETVDNLKTHNRQVDDTAGLSAAADPD